MFAQFSREIYQQSKQYRFFVHYSNKNGFAMQMLQKTEHTSTIEPISKLSFVKYSDCTAADDDDDDDGDICGL